MAIPGLILSPNGVGGVCVCGWVCGCLYPFELFFGNSIKQWKIHPPTTQPPNLFPPTPAAAITTITNTNTNANTNTNTKRMQGLLRWFSG